MAQLVAFRNAGPRFALCTGVAALGAVAGATPPAPYVGPPVLLPKHPSLPDIDRVGPALAVSPFRLGHPTRVIVATSLAAGLGPLPAPSGYIECNISLNDGLSFSAQPLNWTQPCGSYRTDPMAAASPSTGDLYVGGRSANTSVVQRLPYGSTTPTLDPASTIVTDTCGAAPIGFLAMGPQPPGVSNPVETLYLAEDSVPSAYWPFNFQTVKSADTTLPAGLVWGSTQFVTSDIGGVRRYALNPYPVVILDGLRKGRLIVAANHYDPPDPNPPEVTYSDYGGDPTPGLWVPYTLLDHYGSTPDPIYGPGGSSAPVPGSVYVTAAPSVATDPVHPERVYVAFTGRVSETGTNLDLFIARSYNFGTTFLPADTVRVLDTQLRLSADCPGGNCPDETDEWMPTITVDDFGGINLMFFRTQAPDSEPNSDNVAASVRYARWVSDSELTTGVTPFVSDFAATHPYGDRTYIVGGTNILSQSYSYHMVKASGCYVFAAYSTQNSATFQWRTYVRRVRVGICLADLDMSGFIDETDLELFYESYGTGNEMADMNRDEFLDVTDEDSFLEVYCNGCPTDP